MSDFVVCYDRIDRKRQVGGKLFRVPRDIFEEGSSAFAVRYDVNEHTGSETTPVVVDDVEVNDLKSFLKCATNSM